jgi:zinc and cadmium transporter
MLLWIIGFSLLGSMGAVAGASLFLFFSGRHPQDSRPLLDQLCNRHAAWCRVSRHDPRWPEISPGAHCHINSADWNGAFFVLEKLVLWRHCHDSECEVHGRAAPLILIGDAFHNFVDGVVIAAAFLTSIALGVAASLAVIAHEIPQEVGDFAILLDNGYGRTKAIVLNGLSAAATLPGAVVAYFWLGEMRAAVPYILAISAASFIYIAAADLIPGLHRQVTAAASLRQFLLLLAGIGTIAIFHHGG